MTVATATATAGLLPFHHNFYPGYSTSASMSLPELAESPTKETLADARRILEATRVSVRDLTTKIDAAETALAQIVRNSRYAINEMEAQRSALERRVAYALGYLSPIRRLPLELLREIFLWSFEGHPCSAWMLAAVCASWRRLALRTPVIWSKVSASNLLRVLYRSVGLRGCSAGSTLPSID